MPDKILGLDIGNSSLKAVQVMGGLKGYQLTDCARVDIDPVAGLAGALEVLSEQIPFDNATCIASFQPDQVSYHNLTMPFKDKKKIGQTLAFELEPMLPCSAETLATTYVVAKVPEGSRVLSASTPKESLSQYLDTLAAHHIDPDVVDLSAVSAAVQLAKHLDSPTDAAFIDVGSRITSVVLLSGGTVVLVRSFHFGGDRITEAIAASKNISLEEAETLKCEGSGNGLTEVVKPLIESFSRKIENTLHAFRYQVTAKVKPEKFFLTGGGALYPGIGAMLEAYLYTPVELVDLTEATQIEIEESASQCWNPILMNSALALALRDTKGTESFNFRVAQFSKQKRYDQFIGELKRMAVYAAILVLVLVANLYADYHTVKRQYDRLQEEISSIFKKTFPDVDRIVDPVQQMKAKIRELKESTLLPGDFSEQGASIDVLSDIAVRIPENVKMEVSTLTIDEDRARLKGLTDNFNTVDAIKNGLQGSDYFKEISIASAQQDPKSEKVRFELLMERK